MRPFPLPPRTVPRLGFRLPLDTLDHIFRSRSIRHFYPNDIDRLRARREQAPSEDENVGASAIHPAPSS
jgi:hypothetical protein